MPFYKKLFHKIKKQVVPSEWKPETRKQAAELAEAAMMVMPALKVAKVGKVVKVVPKVGKVAPKVIKGVQRVLPRELGLGPAWRDVKFPKPTKAQIEAAKKAQRRFDIIFTRGKETAKQVEKGLKKYFKGKW